MKGAARYSWNVRFHDDYSKDLYRRSRKDFSAGTVPSATIPGVPRAFNFFINSSRWFPRKQVLLYDAAGESYQQSRLLEGHTFYQSFKGLIFLIDPLSIPGLVEKYSVSESQVTSSSPSDMSLEDAYVALAVHLDRTLGIRRDKVLSQPCAIVINKADIFDLDRRIGEEAAASFIAGAPTPITIPEAVDRLCREALEDWGHGNFVRIIGRKFKNHRFFVCSALGRAPDASRTPFQPFGVLEPLSWILSLADKDLSRDIGSTTIET
jgi:hypothetical protein